MQFRTGQQWLEIFSSTISDLVDVSLNDLSLILYGPMTTPDESNRSITPEFLVQLVLNVKIVNDVPIVWLGHVLQQPKQLLQKLIPGHCSIPNVLTNCSERCISLASEVNTCRDKYVQDKRAARSELWSKIV